MKVAVLGESAGDEAALSILVEDILGRPVELTGQPRLRSRGWPSVAQVLPAVIKQLHYRCDADGLVVVVDSDASPVHQIDHDQAVGARNKCRLCHLRQVAEAVTGQLGSVPGRSVLRIAMGLTVPAIEAWYRCGLDAGVTETAWVTGLRSGNHPYTKNALKQAVYGTDRPSLALQERRATEEARRIVQQGLMARLEADFPNTLGSLVTDLRSW